MKVSLNWVKKYVDLPSEVTTKQIAYDLTLRTVEVENVVNTKDKFHDIIVGKIVEVREHPNADKLRVCMVDIGEAENVQIVCGGSNLYEGEYVNGKYYIYSIISSKDNSYLNINYKDNVEKYLKEIENHLSFDFIKK